MTPPQNIVRNCFCGFLTFWWGSSSRETRPLQNPILFNLYSYLRLLFVGSFFRAILHLALLPRDTRLYGAHCCRNDAPPAAPWLATTDLEDTRTAIQAIQAGELASRGFIIRRFPVNDRMTMLTLYPLANR